MASNSYSILAPPVITRVMQATQDKLTLPMPLKWVERANIIDVSDAEMTLKEKSYIFAADIIAADAKAHIRDAGEFSFAQFQSNKIKHGFGINETMTKLLRRLSEGAALDNEYFAFESYIARRAEELEVGAKQRLESMINGMLADNYHYDRLGIKLDGTWGMPADLKFNPVAAWRNANGTVNTSATPITDIINCLVYALRHYGEGYNRVSLTFSALQAIVGTDEWKAIYAAIGFQYYQGTATAAASARAASPMFYLPGIAEFISDAVNAQTNADGTNRATRRVSIEICEGQYREYSTASNINAPQPFHPGIGVVLFTNSDDDNSSSGWDVGNGEVIESYLGRMGGAAIIGDFEGPAWGPVGYTTQADVHLNPPGLVMWNVRWANPRKHRDTCSAKLTAWTP